MSTTAKVNFFPKNVSLRSVINVGFNTGSEARFINIVKTTEQWGTFGNSGPYFNGTLTWMQGIGANGYPNQPAAIGSGRDWGGGIRFPNGSFYGSAASGKYWVLRWKGKGTIEFFGLSNTQILFVSGLSSNVTFNGANGSGVRFATTDDGTLDSYAVFNYEGAAILASFIVRATDPNSVGKFVTDIEIYRKDDEADRNAGKVFRTAYKQTIVDLCPSAIRFMDWVGGNDKHNIRFEYRTPPSYPTWTGRNWNVGAYGRTTGTNQYSLAELAGEPTDIKHGKAVNFQLANGAVRGGSFTISSVTTGANGRVVTTLPHGYVTGDRVRLKMNTIAKTGTAIAGSNTITSLSNNTNLADGSEVFHPSFPVGTTVVSSTSTAATMSNNATENSGGGATFTFMPMPKLHYQCPTITVVDTVTFDTNVNTSTFGNFLGAGGVEQFISLRLGSGGNRDFDYPITYSSGSSLAAGFGSVYYAAGDYKTVTFDKTIAVMKDSSGNWIYGAWIGTNEQGSYVYGGDVPLEVCVALINELNEMSPAKPIHMWINHSLMGLTSNDPDYDVNSHLGIQTMNVLFNGANGWPGLAPNILVFVENSNETWNTANNAFSQSFYSNYKSWQRWWQCGFADNSSYSTLKSSIVMDDILQAMPDKASRIKCVLAGQGTIGAPNTGSLNDIRIDGSRYYANDVLVTGNPRLNGKKPMQYPHKYFAFAGYMGVQASYQSGRLIALRDQWIAAVGNPTAQEAACAAYISDMANGTNSPGGETMFRYAGTLLPQFCARLAPMRAFAIMYEGGWDDNVSAISSSASQYLRPGVFTAGGDTITGLSSSFVTACAVGNWVRGYGVPADARIIAKPTSTSIQLDKNVTINSANGEVMAFTDTNAFLYAVKRSAAWAAAWTAFLDAFNGTINGGMPSAYVEFGIRWGHIQPESYGLGNVEYADHDGAWLAMGARNRALPI